MMRWMIATAALVVAAGSASAQTFKAEIPMSFRVGNALMTPGTYDIKLSDGGAKYFLVRNRETSEGAMVLTGAQQDAPKAWVKDGAPRMSFTCGSKTCTLSTVWTGQDAFAYRVHPSESNNVEARSATTVTLAMVRIH
jgi:hypothetical protein